MARLRFAPPGGAGSGASLLAVALGSFAAVWLLRACTLALARRATDSEAPLFLLRDEQLQRARNDVRELPLGRVVGAKGACVFDQLARLGVGGELDLVAIGGGGLDFAAAGDDAPSARNAK